MSFGDVGFRINKDAHRPHQALLPIRVPTAVPLLSLLSVTFLGFTLRVTTVYVTISDQLLSDDKITPMSGTLVHTLVCPVSVLGLRYV